MMNKSMLNIGCLLLLLGLTACSANKLVKGAGSIIVTKQAAPTDCVFVGEVMGDQGNLFTGRYTSNKNLAKGARNKIKNEALQLGANYVVLETSESSSSFLRRGSGMQTGVVESGNAYKCPGQSQL